MYPPTEVKPNPDILIAELRRLADMMERSPDSVYGFLFGWEYDGKGNKNIRIEIRTI